MSATPNFVYPSEHFPEMCEIIREAWSEFEDQMAWTLSVQRQAMDVDVWLILIAPDGQQFERTIAYTGNESNEFTKDFGQFLLGAEAEWWEAKKVEQ